MSNYLNFTKAFKYKASVEQADELDGRSKLATVFNVGPSMTSTPTPLGLKLGKSSKGGIKPIMLDGKLALIISPYRRSATNRAAGNSKPVYQTDHLQVWHNSKGIRITMTFPKSWDVEQVVSKIDDEIYDLCNLHPEHLKYTEEESNDNSQESDYIQHFDPDV